MASTSLDAELTVAQAAFERGYLTVRELRLALILHEELEKVGTPRPLLALLPALPGHQESDLQEVYQSAQDSRLDETRGIPSPLRDDDVPEAIRTKALERALLPVTQDTERVRRALASIGIGDLPSGEVEGGALPDAPRGGDDVDALPEAIGGYAVLGAVWRRARRVRCRVETEEGEELLLDWLRGSWTDADLQRVARDAQAATRLRHRNLVSVVRAGEHAGRPYWVLEPPAGTTLEGDLSGAPPAPNQAAWIVERLARGLSAAHVQDLGRGGKLEPGEVWISPEGEPLVVGFDPEAALDAGGRPAVPADVAALGRLLYRALTGAPVVDPERPPSLARSEVPRDLDAICLCALSDDPYPSALHFADDLDMFLSGEPVLAATPAAARLQRLLANRPGLVAGLLVGVAAAALIVAAIAWRGAAEADRRRIAAEKARDAANAAADRATERAAILAAAAQKPARPTDKGPPAAAAQAAVWRLVDAIRAERDAPPPVRRALLVRAYRELRRLGKDTPPEQVAWERIGRLALEADAPADALAAFDQAATRMEKGLDYIARVDEGRARALLELGQVSKAEDALGKVLPHRRSRAEREPVKLLRTLELSLQIARRRHHDPAVAKLQNEILAIAKKLPDRGFDAATEEQVVALVEDLAASERRAGAAAFAREAWGWVYARLSARRADGGAPSSVRLQRAGRLRLRLVALDVSLGRTPERAGLEELAKGLEALQSDDPVAAALRATSLRLESAELAAKGEVVKARQAAIDGVTQAQRALAAGLSGARLLLASARLQRGRTSKPEEAAVELEATVLALRALAAERAGDAGPKRVLAEALVALGRLRLSRGEVAPVRPLAQEALTLRRAVGPKDGLGEALLLLGRAQKLGGDGEAAAKTFTEALALWERLHAAPSPKTTDGLRRALTHVAMLKLEREPREALALAERALKLQTGVHPIPELEKLHGVARLLARERQPETPRDHLELAYAFQMAKKPAEALGHFAQALVDPKLRGDLKRSNLYNAACAACLAATVDPAAAQARRKQALVWLAEDLKRRHRYLSRLASEAARRSDPRLKTRLAGLRERWRDHLRWAAKDDPDLAALRDWPEFKRLLARYTGKPRKK